MPAVKGDGYGLGAVEICRELNQVGIDAFCVATVDEGIELRQHGVEGEILVLGYTPPDIATELSAYKLTQTAINDTYARQLAAQGYALPVHIKIDTGMHRLGVHPDDVNAVKSILTLDKLHAKGIYTKLACCDSRNSADMEYTKLQLQSFQWVLAALGRGGRHLAAYAQCSYGIINYPGKYGYVRPGAALYGIVEQEKCIVKTPPLKPIFEVKARVALIREIASGECVGYDRAFVAPHTMCIAIISIGYADGLPRGLSCGAGKVLIDGQFAPIVGRVCMDQTMVDITEIGGAEPGDEVVIIGCNGQQSISVQDVARWAGTIPNEILSRLGKRMNRVHQEGLL